MGLNQRQKQAVEYLEGPLLVLAGPGTGKTQLLSEKVAYILKNTDTNPENILCMTFTETGAANMRERLKSIIGNAGARVNINTYHAFGVDILAQYENYSENCDEKLGEAIDEVTQFKIVKEIQSKLPAKDILRKDNVSDIVSVISSAKGAGLSAEDLEKIATQNLEDSKTLSEAISPLLKNVVPRAFKESYEQAYLPIYEILKNYTEAEVILKKIERSIGGIARDLKAAIVEAESEQKIKPLSSWKDAYFEKDGRGNYRLKDRIANKKLASVAKVMKEYEGYLRTEGRYDFDDMIQKAVEALKKDAGFRATLAEKYQFIMLDEFQDTNPAQFMIIKQLTDYEKPVVMAVGDDDQAIYEFQGALSTNLADFQEYYEAKVIPLTENYRSSQEILDFAREVINQAPDRFADKELTAHRPNPEQSEIYRYEFVASEMEYSFVAKKIRDLIRSGVKQDEIAVISYKTKYFLPLLTYLKAYPEIKIAYEKRDNLLEDDKIHQILTVSEYVLDLATGRGGNPTIMEILAYPFFDLPMLEVIREVEKARKTRQAFFETLAESENEKIAEVMRFLANLVQKALTEPLEIFLDYLIGARELEGYQSQFLKKVREEGEYEEFRFYENLASLRGKLRKHCGDKSLRLDDLTSMVRDYDEAGMMLSVSSPYRDADEAVQILSAHKAKGLEFRYVFLISADHTAWGKGKGNNNLLSLPKNLAQIRHTGTTDGEKLRILYVAITRAKEALFITNSLRDFNGKSPDRLEYLEEYVEGEKVISPFLPSREVITMYEARANTAAVDNLKNWLKPYAKLTPDMRALYRSRVQNYRLSATGLTAFIDLVYAGPQAFFRDRILRAPQEVSGESLVFGNLIHETFEAVTNQNLSDEKAVEMFLERLERAEVDSETRQKLREKGPADLMISLREFAPILRKGKAEVNLGPDKIAVQGVPLTGKIDHIVIDEEKKEIEIYDFKTGGYNKGRWQSHVMLYKYMLQLGFYKLLLNNSSLYRKYKISRAHILFVAPDKDDEVHDKVYEFEEEAEKELIALIQAVYQQIVTLNFIQDPEIFLPADKNATIHDIKRFIERLLGDSSRSENTAG